MRLKIKIGFWGVRGSIATHYLKNVRYGGHTSCVSIHFDNHWFVCDAGTGIRLLGQELSGKKGPITIFLSHLHWDHLFGLPFFKPLYERRNKIILAGPSTSTHPFKKTLNQIMHSPYFPITPHQWNSKIHWMQLREGRFRMGKVLVESRWVDHTDKTLGFQFYFPGGKRIVYVADQDLRPNNRKFARWVQGADLLIHDTQYDRKEHAKHKGWGHSAYETVLEMAVEAGVKKLVLFHHDPNASDRLLEGRLKKCRRLAKNLGSPIQCLLARETSTLSV